MPAPVPSTTPTVLDRILAIQLTVAWAGECHGEPPELGWWATTLADPDGGGDFLRRMFPRTRLWAALGGMREAARRADERARAKMANPDALITLFHFGFEWDEALRERFDHHQRSWADHHNGLSTDHDHRSLADVASHLGPACAVREAFSRAAFEAHIAGLTGEVAFEIVPGGRQLTGPPPAPGDAAVRLAGALLPLSPDYPLPFFKREGR